MADETTPAAPVLYKDDDLVYVDPDTRTVVGIVQWGVGEKPKSLARSVPVADVEEEGDPAKKADPKKGHRPGPTRLRFYPWGTYRSMKRIYKLEGKQPRVESTYTLNDVIEKALSQPFWD